MSRLVLQLQVLIYMHVVFSDVALTESRLTNPQIIAPKDCETLQTNSFSVIILVPVIEDINMEWILFMRSDNTIWDYDIPPTPYTTIKQFKPKLITHSADFSTLNFDINDLNMPSFVHLSIRLIHKTNKLRNTSFETSSILIRITDQNHAKETENLQNLYKNAQMHFNKLKNEYAELQMRYDTISKQYKTLTMDKISLPKIWDDKYLTDSFKNAVMNNEIYYMLNPTNSDYVFKINNIFTDEFLIGMINEIKTAKILLQNGAIELLRPNSMNNDGFVLKELGYGPFFDEFMTKWISKITSSIYPFYLWCGESLDYIHGFTIRYAMESDINLNRHMDQSQITFNLCLQNEDSIGTKIWFNGVRDNIHTMNENVSISLLPNQVLMHAGQHWHSTEDIQKGQRINLVLWFRSSFCRNSVSEYAFDVCPNFIPADSTDFAQTIHNDL